MARSRDFPYAWSCLNPLQTQLESTKHQFILFNDVPDPGLEKLLAQRSNSTLLTPGENLGVARGRNRLIQAALDWGADFIVSLDDDLLVPTDYVDRVLRHFDELKQAGYRVGIVGPTVLDYHAAQLHDPERQTAVENGELTDFVSTSSLRKTLVDTWGGELPSDVAYHMGIRAWDEHYLRAAGPRAARLRSMARSLLGVEATGTAVSGEIRRTELRNAALDGSARPVPVDTLAGGVCAYPSALVAEIGLIEEAFSPFGYEDAEFAIRASEAGFANFLLPSEILLHDLASRNKERSARIVFAGLGKARALLTRKHIAQQRLGPRLAETLALGMLQVGFATRSRLGGEAAPGAALVAGLLTYWAGIAAGLYRPLSTPRLVPDEWEPRSSTWGPGSFETDSGPVRYERLAVRMIETDETLGFGPPVRFDGDIEGVSFGIGGRTLGSGLPKTLKGSGGLTYHMDLAARRLEVTRLLIDVPGLITIEASGSMAGVGPGKPEPEVTADDVAIESLDIRVQDRGAISRLESSVAWAQGLTGEGLLASVAPNGSSATSGAVRSWLISRGPGTLDIRVRPGHPVSVGALNAAYDQGGDVALLLGLTARFHADKTQSVHS